ncbi:excalibur calcium-binding domain-containing protein [Actinoplanes sp. RD1]|uniref:excalibur calcium-binding domain-containing protein n=1 Tax=Actinoplanes sp. RD1 TaxID=3064538 RepID=UPI0027427E98|nr:excalibur calcium-binding domain-containing protein [Actinoplanes sp. RD1]
MRLTMPWEGALARRRAEQARRKAEEERLRRRNLTILGGAGVVLAVVITIGALTEDDRSGRPGSDRAAADVPSPAPVRGRPAGAVVATGSPAPKPATTKPATRKPATKKPATKDPVAGRPAPAATTAGASDPRFSTCAKANAAGYGPYRRGADIEYGWYRDRDKDGVVCE